MTFLLWQALALVIARIGGVSIHAEMRIVALHGQVGMASDWDSLAERLSSEGHELDAVDLWSYLEVGELGLEKSGAKLNSNEPDGGVLLGYSMGGRLALHALIDQPQKWKAAVIISASSGVPLYERKHRRVMDDEWASKVEDLPWAEFLNQWNQQGVLDNEVMPDRAQLENRRAEIAQSFRCWSLSEQNDLLGQLSLLKIPVLWVVGERDEKFRHLGESANRVLDNSKLVITPNAGHRVPWEAERNLAEAVISWLDTEL